MEENLGRVVVYAEPGDHGKNLSLQNIPTNSNEFHQLFAGVNRDFCSQCGSDRYVAIFPKVPAGTYRLNNVFDNRNIATITVHAGLETRYDWPDEDDDDDKNSFWGS